MILYNFVIIDKIENMKKSGNKYLEFWERKRGGGHKKICTTEDDIV